ncbi:hypothetical protein [Streptosporangium sp. V21-05]|uniref:hypothetical protein n=1 Tax=Streptosporangium sp. V21-05 TaxID=3446115 RepID=UPI003F52F6C7
MNLTGLAPLKTLSVIAGIGALVFSTAMPAQAHLVRAYHGDDYASIGADHRWVEVCDIERDGNGVYASFTVRGTTGPQKVGDPNGSAAGCGNRVFSGEVLGFSLCEDVSGNNNCVNKNH